MYKLAKPTGYTMTSSIGGGPTTTSRSPGTRSTRAVPKRSTPLHKEITDYLKDADNFGTIATTGGIGLGALGLSSALGVSAANKAQRRLAAAGFSEEEIDAVLTDGGAFGRSLGNQALYGLGGAGLGYGLGSILDRNLNTGTTSKADQFSAANALGALGALAGVGVGARKSFKGEGRRATKAIKKRKVENLEKKVKRKGKRKSRRTKKADYMGILKMAAAGQVDLFEKTSEMTTGDYLAATGLAAGVGLGGLHLKNKYDNAVSAEDTAIFRDRLSNLGTGAAVGGLLGGTGGLRGAALGALVGGALGGGVGELTRDFYLDRDDRIKQRFYGTQGAGGAY